MNKIKLFQYKDTKAFEEFVSAYGYKLEDVKGFKFIGKKQWRGNVLKFYFICLNDGEEVYFTVEHFKSWSEYQECYLGFHGDKLLAWCEDAIITTYKVGRNTYICSFIE